MGIVRALASGDMESAQVTQEEWFDLPKRWKRITSIGIGEHKRVSTLMMSGGKLWETDDDGALQGIEMEPSIDSFFAAVKGLPNIIAEKAKISRLGERHVKTRPAFGIRSVWERTAADYYFDQATGLLVQVEFAWASPAGKEGAMRVEFNDYREIDGIKLPYRQTAFIKIGKGNFFPLADFVVKELKMLEALPEDTFEIPGRAEAENELKQMQGTWSHHSREVNGKQISWENKDLVLTVAGEKWFVTDRGEVFQRGELKIVDARGPLKKFDLRITNGPNKGLTVLCVYRIDGDVLSYCGNDETRPTSLQTKPGDRSYCSRFKRLKE